MSKDLLYFKMQQKGYNKFTLAEVLNISYPRFLKLFENLKSWRVEDIYNLQEILELSNDDILAIFFAQRPY